MDLSINFDFFSNFLNLYSNLYPNTKKKFLYFKLSYSKFARESQNSQIQTRQCNPNNMWILGGVWVSHPNPNPNPHPKPKIWIFFLI